MIVVPPKVKTPEGARVQEPESAGIESPMVEVDHLRFFYSGKEAVKNVTVTFARNRISALIGPSGCGKSTLLRCLNRMNELIDGVTHEGTIRINGMDIYDPAHDITDLRKRVGMVFQKSNPFPKSIYEN